MYPPRPGLSRTCVPASRRRTRRRTSPPRIVIVSCFVIVCFCRWSCYIITSTMQYNITCYTITYYTILYYTILYYTSVSRCRTRRHTSPPSESKCCGSQLLNKSQMHVREDKQTEPQRLSHNYTTDGHRHEPQYVKSALFIQGDKATSLAAPLVEALDPRRDEVVLFDGGRHHLEDSKNTVRGYCLDIPRFEESPNN